MNSISVIIPVYNGARYIREAVRSALEQTLKPDEIIVVDDGSTDDTPRVLKALAETGIIAIRKGNAGAGSARNQGIETATGSLIAFLDADDVWLPEKLATQTRILREHSNIGYVVCNMEEFYSPELADELQDRTPLRNGSLSGMLPSSALIRKSVFKKVGLFNTLWRTGEFMDWVLRANEASISSYQLKEILVRRRVHDTNLGRSAAASHDYHHILKAALDRKRKRSSDS